jgi:hypothetical protein
LLTVKSAGIIIHMRWEELFSDLEAQADVLATRERALEIDDRARAELGRVALVERLLPAVGGFLSLRCLGAVRVDAVLDRVGPDWLLLTDSSGHEAIVGLTAVLSVSGVGRSIAAPGSLGAVESRLGLRTALRGVARDRSAVRLQLIDGSVLDGTLDRVGADFFELATHAPGELRRRREVRDVQVLPFRGLSVLSRLG